MFRIREKPWLYSIVAFIVAIISGVALASVIHGRVPAPDSSTKEVAVTSAGEIIIGASSLGTLDADDTAACLAIPNAETDYTLTHNMTEICASGNTVYIDCDDAAPVTADHTVGNFSIVVPAGSCVGPYDFGTDLVCSYIGVAAGGFVCFLGVDR